MTSPCAPPTIHHNILARHVTRRIGAKELDRRAIFVGSRHAPERDQLRQAGDELVIPAIVDAAGRKGVDADPGTIPIGDRKSVVSGKSVTVRVDLGGPCILKNKILTKNTTKRNTTNIYLTKR